MLPKNFPYRKEIRHKEAVERQAAYDSLSLTEKLARLAKHQELGLGQAKRQRTRLEHLQTQGTVQLAVEPEAKVADKVSEKSTKKTTRPRKSRAKAKDTQA